LENFHRALKLAPDDGDILKDMGIAYFKSGHPVEAIIYLGKAVEIEESNTTAAFYLGKTYEAQGNYPKSLEIYKNLEKKNPDDVDVQYGLASAYGKTDKLGESHYHFGIYFKKQNKPASALFHFREALKYFPPGSSQAKDIESQIKTRKTENEEAGKSRKVEFINLLRR